MTLAAVHGKDAVFLFNGYAMSPWLRDFKIKLANKLKDNTCFGKQAECFQGGLFGSSLTANGLADGNVGAIDPVLRAALAVNSGDEDFWEALIFGDVLGAQGLALRVRSSDYSTNPVHSELVSCMASAIGSNLWHATQILQVLASKTNSGNSTAWDNTTTNANGGCGYLQVGALTGTSVTGKIQHSTDNFATDTTDLVVFTAVTASHKRQAVEFSGTVKRYRRAIWAGTFVADLHFSLGLNP